MGRAILIIGAAALLAGIIIYALIDCIRTDRKRAKVLPKPLWVLIILLFPLIGALLWLVFGKVARSSSFGHTKPKEAPRAPDDDPDYLRFLEAQARRQAQSRQQEEARRQEKTRRRQQENQQDDDTPGTTP